MSGFYSIFVDPNLYSTDGYGDGYAFITPQGVSVKTAVFEVIATNHINATRFVQIFDGYALPPSSTNSHPVAELQLDGYAQGSLSFLAGHWLPLQYGCVVASSTTSSYYTAGGSKDLFLTVLFNTR